MATPAVSVLMPVYQGKRFLARAIASVLAQSAGDLELLVVDDGSRDRSARIAERFARLDPRVRVLRRPHGGHVAALNAGLREARAPLVARLDADDEALPGRLAAQRAFLADHPEVVCVGGGYVTIDWRGRTLAAFDALPRSDAEIQARLLAGDTVIAHSAATFRRAPVLAAGGYDAGLVGGEDLDLWLRLGDRYQLANLAERVLRYRQHARSLSARAHALQVERMRAACERAWARRGVSGRFVNPGWLPRTRREASLHFARHGRRALRRGDRWMAFEYAVRALRSDPRVRGAWKLAGKAVRPWR